MISKEAIEFMTFIKVNSSVDSAYVGNPPHQSRLFGQYQRRKCFVQLEKIGK